MSRARHIVRRALVKQIDRLLSTVPSRWEASVLQRRIEWLEDAIDWLDKQPV